MKSKWFAGLSFSALAMTNSAAFAQDKSPHAGASEETERDRDDGEIWRWISMSAFQTIAGARVSS